MIGTWSWRLTASESAVSCPEILGLSAVGINVFRVMAGKLNFNIRISWGEKLGYLLPVVDLQAILAQVP